MRESECRNIYRQAFSDPDTSFEDMLFMCCYKYCRTLEVDGNVVSMLFALPCVVRYNAEEIKATYVYAAATNKENRKKGYMKKLLEKVKAEAEGDFILLRPANETLIDYYSKCGFKTVKSSVCSGCLKVIPIDGYKTLLEISHLSDDRDFTAMYYTERNIEAEVIEFNCSMN